MCLCYILHLRSIHELYVQHLGSQHFSGKNPEHSNLHLLWENIFPHIDNPPNHYKFLLDFQVFLQHINLKIIYEGVFTIYIWLSVAFLFLTLIFGKSMLWALLILFILFAFGVVIKAFVNPTTEIWKTGHNNTTSELFLSDMLSK